MPLSKALLISPSEIDLLRCFYDLLQSKFATPELIVLIAFLIEQLSLMIMSFFFNLHNKLVRQFQSLLLFFQAPNPNTLD